jgi:hypothetical protein
MTTGMSSLIDRNMGFLLKANQGIFGCGFTVFSVKAMLTPSAEKVETLISTKTLTND